MRTIHRKSRPSGFTLVELSVVILIIGLLITFVLVASAAGLESARKRATQALITKLSVGLEDRLEAILNTQIEPTGAHRWLASVQVTSPPFSAAQAGAVAWGLRGDQRAQVIARLDQIRAEFPDVFFIDPAFVAGTSLYLINFAGVPYPWQDGSSSTLLPLGTFLDGSTTPPSYRANAPGNTFSYIPGQKDASGNALYTGRGYGDGSPGFGNNGASYAAAASLHKLIGYNALGCNGVDDNNNGLIDEYTEGLLLPDGTSEPQPSTPNVPPKTALEKITAFRNNHQHKTARSEMLYALLVEGLGPLGSVFSREDFRDNEIRDTDNDGVPEFIDGWGEPLQFFRWPIAYQSGIQKGAGLYSGTGETRQQNPLDPNGQLTSIAWWGTLADATRPSDHCRIVQSIFGPLADPNWTSGTPNPGYMWDRSGATGRRAYFSKFLILSSGPDERPGVILLDDVTIKNATTTLAVTQAIIGSVSYDSNGRPVSPFLLGEDWANPTAATPDDDPSLDDLTNHDLQNRSGGL